MAGPTVPFRRGICEFKSAYPTKFPASPVASTIVVMSKRAGWALTIAALAIFLLLNRAAYKGYLSERPSFGTRR